VEQALRELRHQGSTNVAKFVINTIINTTTTLTSQGRSCRWAYNCFWPCIGYWVENNKRWSTTAKVGERKAREKCYVRCQYETGQLQSLPIEPRGAMGQAAVKGKIITKELLVSILFRQHDDH